MRDGVVVYHRCAVINPEAFSAIKIQKRGKSMSKTLLFGMIMAIMPTVAFADSKTITTRDYVDTADALKQDKITGHSRYRPDSVITDTTDDGVVAKRLTIGSDGWMSPDWWASHLLGGHVTQNPSDLIQEYVEDGEFTMDELNKSFVQTNVLESALETLARRISNNKMTCARYVQNAAETPENCLLWNVPD